MPLAMDAGQAPLPPLRAMALLSFLALAAGGGIGLLSGNANLSQQASFAVVSARSEVSFLDW
jgi:hypothetical protein